MRLLPRFRVRTLILVGAALLVGSSTVAVLVLGRDSGSRSTRKIEGPNALLVDRFDAGRLVLAADDGAFESLDGGRSWTPSGLGGRDVVALARLEDGTLWAGGRDFLARSSDRGRSWEDVHPSGLPNRNVRALSGSRDVSDRLEAAMRGVGLFRSRDGGRTFAKLGVSDVGAEANDVAETIDGVIFVSDQRLGVLVNGNGDGVEWIRVLGRSITALAPNYGDRHDGLLLAGSDEGVLRTTNKGQTWETVLALDGGAAEVAFSQSTTNVAYAVAGDGTTHRSTDFGATWTPMR